MNLFVTTFDKTDWFCCFDSLQMALLSVSKLLFDVFV